MTPVDTTDQNSDFSYWGPHLLHIPAFIDVMIVMYIVMRERGRGSLEKQPSLVLRAAVELVVARTRTGRVLIY